MADLLSLPHLSAALERLDLSPVHFFLCFAGALLCVYYMTIMRAAKLTVPGDTRFTRGARHFGLGLLALAMCWGMAFAAAKDWQPWPPAVLLVFAVDLLLLVNVIVSRRTLKAPGRFLRA